MDLGTGLALYASKDLIVRLLGPTADYLGEDWKKTRAPASRFRGLVQKQAENLGRIGLLAVKKLGDRIDSPGSVSPRAFKQVIEEGMYCEDALAAEYLGGVLASSRSGVPRDDRGAVLAALVGRLTVYQLRTHYIFYRELKRLWTDDPIEGTLKAALSKRGIVVPWEGYTLAMEFGEDEDPEILLAHSLIGLTREGLVEWSRDGMPIPFKEMREGHAASQLGEFVMFPSPQGLELYMAAHGRLDLGANAFFDHEIKLQAETPVPAVPNCRWRDRKK